MLGNINTTTSLVDDFIPQFLNYLKRSLPGLQHDLLEHAGRIVKDHASSVQKWIAQSSTGEISVSDLRWLVQSQMDLSSLNTLKETGLSLVKLDELRQAMVSSLVTTIFKVNIFR
jgi:hypothetical protein